MKDVVNASYYSSRMLWSFLIILIFFFFQPTHPTKNTCSNMMDVALQFDKLLVEGNYQDACDQFLTDDFVFSNPRSKVEKANFVKDFPALHKEAPTFEAFQPGDHDLQVTRKGKKRIAMMNISMKETWEFTSDGKIKSITGAKG